MGAAVNAGELRALLDGVDPSKPVLVSGYEGGYTTAADAGR